MNLDKKFYKPLTLGFFGFFILISTNDSDGQKEKVCRPMTCIEIPARIN